MYVKNKIKIIDMFEHKDNFYCGLCDYPLTNFFDFKKSKEYNSCYDCYLKFIEGKKEKWKEGWRPTKKEIEEYINLRKELIKRNN